ncbi:hypothetical protein GALL_410670 [mine drainage metagenome]|uniref:Uncharacterized protein n=1 Tax=mine drainage metagenome TaxID=410659 RepID=A0A1J5QIB2_9ZZZZ
MNDVGHFHLGRIQAALLQHFDHAYHAVHGGANFVTHRGQKLRLGQIGLFGVLGGHLKSLVFFHQRLLHHVFGGHIAKHQHGTHHEGRAVTNRGTTVCNGVFATIAGDQYGVVVQSLSHAAAQGFFDRYHSRPAGSLI